MIFEDVASIKVWARIVRNLRYAKTIGLEGCMFHVDSVLLPEYDEGMKGCPITIWKTWYFDILYPVLVAFSVDEPEFKIPTSHNESWNCYGIFFFEASPHCPGDLDGLSQRLGHESREIHPHRGYGGSHWESFGTCVNWYCWWFRNPAITSWNGKTSYYFTGFFYMPGGWEWDFWTINSMVQSLVITT